MTTTVDRSSSTLGPTFGRVLAAEWIKIKSVRSTVLTLVFMVVLGVGISALGAVAVHVAVSRHRIGPGFDPVASSLGGMLIAQIAIGVLGVLVFSAEVASGTIGATFAAIPNRWHVLIAKVLVYFVIALVAAEVVSVVSFLVGQAIMHGVVPTTSLSNATALRAVLGTGLIVAIVGVLALAIGVIVRRTAGAITAFVGVYLVLPLLVNALPSPYSTDISKFLPFQVAQVMMSSQPVANSLSAWVGVAVVAAYAVIAVVVAGSLLSSRDA